jgi:uncharacterized Zn finger protein (UPF0148 family)
VYESVEKCPYCKNPLVYDSEHCEIVCPHCGLVIDDRPLVSTSSSRNKDSDREDRKHRRRRPVLISTDDTWLRAGLEIVRDLYMYKRVFSDTCTLKTAERILSEIYQNVPRRKLPNCEHAAKFAVLIASRRCGEIVELKRLFNSISEVYELLKHDYLRKLYTPPDKATQITQHALRIAKCLDEIVISSEVMERVKMLKLGTISSKPVNIAIALVYSMLRKRVDLSKLAECSNTTIHAVKNAIRKYTHLF